MGKLYAGGLAVDKTYSMFRLDTNDYCNPPVTAKLGEHDVCFLAGYEAHDIGKTTNPSIECYVWPEGLSAISTYTTHSNNFNLINGGSIESAGYKPIWRARADVDHCRGQGLNDENTDSDARCNFLCVDFK